MNRMDLLKLDKSIEETKNSGKELAEEIAMPLKNHLMDEMIVAMSSKDPQIKSLAYSVSRKFLKCDDAHKLRIIEKISRYEQ